MKCTWSKQGLQCKGVQGLQGKRWPKQEGIIC